MVTWLSDVMGQTQGWLAERRIDRLARAACWVAVVAFVCITTIGNLNKAASANPFDYMSASKRFPSRACDFILSHKLVGPMFNDYDYGGYLISRLWPKYEVFVDSRQDLFIDGALEDSYRACNCKPLAFWQPVFRKYGVNLVVIDSTFRSPRRWSNARTGSQSTSTAERWSSRGISLSTPR